MVRQRKSPLAESYAALLLLFFKKEQKRTPSRTLQLKKTLQYLLFWKMSFAFPQTDNLLLIIPLEK